MTTPEMTTSKLTRALLALLVASAATIASAQESRPPTQHGEQRASEPRQGEQRQADAREGVLRLLPADSVTEHAVAIPGGTLTYTATAGTLSLFDQSGERSAAVYYTAYVAKNAEPANRPVTFAFNGGPGAAWSARASSSFPVTTPRPLACGTIPRPGSPLPIWS